MTTKLTRILLLIASLSFSSIGLIGCGDDTDIDGEIDSGDGEGDGKRDDELCEEGSAEPLHACSEFTKNCTPFDNARVPLVDGKIPHP